MVVDIGGGTTEIAVISLGGIVYAESVKVGGDKMDTDIAMYIRRNHSLLIGESSAEKIKKELGNALITKKDANKTMKIKGRHLTSGIPVEISISEEDISSALKDTTDAIINGVLTALEKTPPELSADIVEKGIMLTGGGGNLRNFDEVLRKKTGPPVVVSDHALGCVALGAGKCLEEMKVLRNVLIS